MHRHSAVIRRRRTSKLPVFIVLCVALVLIEHLMFGKTAVKPAAQLVGSGIMGTQSTAMGHSGQIFWSYCDERHTTTYR